MISEPEKILSKNFKKILATYKKGDIVQYSEELNEAINNLEIELSFLFMSEYRDEWKHGRLDGVYDGYIYN